MNEHRRKILIAATSLPFGMSLTACGGGDQLADTPPASGNALSQSVAVVNQDLIANAQSSWPNEYFGETVLDEDDIYGIQDAIDATPTDLVTSIDVAAATSLGNGIYSFPVSAEPHSSTLVFLDGTLAAKNSVVLGSAVGPDYQAGHLWAYANSKIYVYQSGSAFAGAALVKPWNIQLKGRRYDGYVSKPGVVVTGMGASNTRVEQLTSRSLSFNSSQMEFVVATAAYSGRRNLTVFRGPTIGTPNQCCGEYVRWDESSASWFAEDSPLVISSDFKSLGYYYVGIFFAAGFPSKNIRYFRSPIANKSIVYSFETFSATFNGSVFFEESPIRGTYTIDGTANTFVFLNSPKNASSLVEGVLTRPDAEVFPNEGSAYNLTPTLSYGPFPGFDFLEINIDSPAFVPSRSSSYGDVRTYAYALANGGGKESPVCWINSPVSGDGKTELLLAGSAGLTPSPVLARQFYAVGSALPTLLVTSLHRPTALVTTNTPQVARVVRDGIVRSAGSTPLYLGCFAIHQLRLASFRRARVTVSGSFASTSSTKLLNFQAGTPGSLSNIVSKSGSFAGNLYKIVTDLVYANGNVQISISFLANGVMQLAHLAELPLAEAARFGFDIEAIGVNNYDVVASLQMIELG